jgi:hypothetical protein
MPQYLAGYMPEYLAEYMPEHWIVTGALLGILLLAALSRLVSRSRLIRLREAAMYVIGETDCRVGLWLQLHPEQAAEPGSLGRCQACGLPRLSSRALPRTSLRKQAGLISRHVATHRR